MSTLVMISNMILPVVILLIVAIGLGRKLDVYALFIRGAEDGFQTVIKIMPTLIGLMVAVGVLRASGFFDFLSWILTPVVKYLALPAEVVPFILIKMFSSSAATGLALDLFKTYGTDSYIGTLVSLSMSSTETVFYTMSVYFMVVKITKTRYTLTGALIATVSGVAASVAIALWMCG
ncbi:MAG: spore maturation protein [Lachnospiraceae bacterium]|nr:spore maturation protein [Lachnospiraceae bacterium]